MPDSAGDKWVQLNNAISRLGTRYPTCASARNLNQQWSEWFFTPEGVAIRSSTLLPPVFDWLTHWWAQYDKAYGACQSHTADPDWAPPPSPESIEPHYTELLEDSAESYGRDFGKAGSAFADAVTDVFKTPWPWLIGAGVAFYYLGGRRR